MGSWVNALGGTWGTVASFVIGSARSVYWHTRVEDSTTSEAVQFTTTIKESNVLKTERVAFDGFTLVCWKKDGINMYMAACLSTNILEYQKDADTDLGKNQELCQDTNNLAECIDLANENADDSETDENGGVINPWTS